MTAYPPRRILVGLDDSDPSRFSLAYAAGVAVSVGAPGLWVEEVGSPLTLMPGVPGPGVADVIERQRIREQAARARMESEVAPYSRRLDFVIRWVEGDPATTLAASAEHLKADLVVVGSHGRTGASRVLLGSVAESVIRHAPVPVLVVRQPSDGAPEAPDKAPPRFPPAHIVATTDFSERAARGVDYAARMAADAGARLTILHAGQGKVGERAQVEGALAAEVERLGLAGVQTCYALGGPKVLGEAAEDLGAELLVFASHGRTGAARILLGSVAERTARAARCPVLVVK